MSWGTCYSGSNNIHFDFPPIMTDGRNYANWLPGGALNDKVRKDAGIASNWQYRRYLTENADTIIRQNQVTACDECGVNSANANVVAPANVQQNEKRNNQMFVQPQTPYLYKSYSDMSQPNYGYETSDLKNMYLSDMQLQSRMVTPVITQEQLVQRGYAHQN
jgi:hypothetical protein